MNSYVRAISFSVPLGTEMFHFPRCPAYAYVFSAGRYGIPRIGLPHSDILGSQVACHLPETFRRLLRPSSARSVEPSSVCTYALQPLSVKICQWCLSICNISLSCSIVNGRPRTYKTAELTRGLQLHPSAIISAVLGTKKESNRLCAEF